MNRKYLIFIIAFIVIAIAAGAIYSYVSSFRKVAITLERPDMSAELFKRDPNSDESNNDTKEATLSSSQTLSLQPGKYYLIPKGDKLDQSQISFTVGDKDTTISVNPGYSQDYLNSLLDKELPTIRAVLTTKYPAITSYSIQRGKLYEDGTWYGTLLVEKVAPQDVGDTYRVVLHKVKDTWQVAAAPQLVLTTPDNKDVPEAVLRDLNKQTGE